MFVAHALFANGAPAYTRAGFPTQFDAEVVAVINDHHGGGWTVVEASMGQWNMWVCSDHSQPVNGVVRASGGTQRKTA